MSKTDLIEDILDLSPMQEGLLFHYLYDDNKTGYNIQVGMTIKGELDIKLLEKSYKKLISNYEIFRTLFVYDKTEKPRQVILKERNSTILFHDIRRLSKKNKESFIFDFLKKDYNRVFDLKKDLLFNLSVIQEEENLYKLIISYHHIIMDGWSFSLIINRLLQYYKQYKLGEPEKQEKIYPYSNYLKWLNKQDNEKGLYYWRQYLEDYEHTTNLPFIKEETANKVFLNCDYDFSLDPELSKQIEQLTKKTGVTLNNVFQTVFGLLLQKYNLFDDVVFGNVISVRPAEIDGIGSVVGLLINTMPVRIDSNKAATFRDLLKQVHLDFIQNNPYGYLPLNQIQKVSSNDGSLINILYVFENYPISNELPSGGLTEQLNFSLDFDFGKEQTNYDLNCKVLPGDTLAFRIAYNRNKIDEFYIRNMHNHILKILNDIVDNPDCQLEDLNIVTKEEKQTILNDFNDTHIDYPKEKCIHQLFEDQVAKTPDNIAIVFEGQELTYRELNEKANQLGRYLRKKGVKANSLVAIVLERAPEMIIGILAILKAGGAYLPIIPDYPDDRIEFMLKDSNTKILLTDSTIIKNITSDLVTLYIDDEKNYHKDNSNLINKTKQNDLAYIIYTSGSTGKPKGVMIEHKNLVSVMLNDQNFFNFNHTDTWTLFHSFCFDFSVWEMYGALLYGGKLVIISDDIARNPQEFLSILKKQKVTVLNQTPSSFYNLAKEELKNESNDLVLRYIIFGGEALKPAKLKEWKEKYSDTKLINMYGITETTIHVTYKEITHREITQNVCNIGKALPTLTTYITDKSQRILPIGVAGELCIGGEGVARGYLNRNDLNSTKFIENPYKPGEIIYKSGDLVRRIPNGEIVYLGRIDDQVKIRGFRIELGEIENTLSQLEEISSSVVLAHEDKNGNKKLVAYIIPSETHNDSEFNIETIRKMLSKTLPDYMVPSLFIKIKTLPLTPNGKIDKKALPSPEKNIETDHEYVAPKTEIEKKLTTIWKDVLGVDKVGIHDNFFELGGDSILSIQVVSRAKEKNLVIDIKQLFESRTIHQLAQSIEESTREIRDDKKLVAFELISDKDRSQIPTSIEDAYPMTALQTGMLFHTEFQNTDETMYIAIASFHIKAKLDVDAFRAAIKKVILNHPVLRTSFNLTDYSIPMQLVHREIPDDILEYFDINQYSPEKQENIITEWVREEKKRKFDVNSPPLIKFFIHKRNDTTFQFGWNEHHAILDGWSDIIMFSEIFEIYFSMLEGDSCDHFRELSINFRDFVSLEQNAITSEEHKNFWKRKLEDTSFLKLPRLYPKEEQEDRWGEYLVKLPESLAVRVELLANKAGVPLKSVFFTGYLYALSRFTNENKVMTGMVMNGRPETDEGEKILGLFLNTIPFFFELKGGRWIDLINEVFETELDYFPYRRYPLSEMQKNEGGELFAESAFNYVYFHAISKLYNQKNFEILKMDSYGQTNYSFSLTISKAIKSNDFGLGYWFDPDQFEIEFVEAFSDFYISILEHMTNNPESRYDTGYILPDSHRQNMLINWNKSEVKYDTSHTILHRFEQMAIEKRNNIALVDGSVTMSYQEVNSKANQLAHYLIKNGFAKKDLGVICVDRSCNQIISILAILKAGGTYIPIDPRYPEERIQYILEDTKAVVFIVDQQKDNHFAHLHKMTVNLQTENQEIENEQSYNHPIKISDDDLAYIIYTSGSTGRPKGVKITHANVVNLVCWHNEHFSVSERDRATQIASVGFDASVWEVWPYLSVGAALHIVPSDLIGAPKDLKHWINMNQITICFLPTPLAEEFVYQDWKSGKTTLKVLHTAGDVLKCYAPENLPFKFINNYGPTEYTVCTTSGEVPCGSYRNRNPSIGRPIANTKVYIMDHNLQPVPLCVPGELFITGKGLSIGYLGKDELTKSRFVQNPLNKNEKLYRTGDICRWLPNGEIDFIGREDNQVKLRGIRIELGEIEALLKEHQLVKDAVVIPRKDKQGKRLIAFLEYNRKKIDSDIDSIQQLKSDHVEHWEDLFEDTYNKESEQNHSISNIKGWNSSYTGKPIPEKEMDEWVDEVVQQIIDLKPKRVLEIGCGTGLLLFRVASRCDLYYGTDFSGEALRYIESLEKKSGLNGIIKLKKCEADQIGSSMEEKFDLVVINSVVQYFPSIQYLYDVIKQVIGLLSDEGKIFLGDIRSLPLFKLYHTSVELFKASGREKIEELQMKIGQQLLNENELLVDPRFFSGLVDKIERIENVRIHAKERNYINELSKFRYQVIISCSKSDVHLTDIEWKDFNEFQGIEGIKRMLETNASVFAISNIPNDRLTYDQYCMELIHSISPEEKVIKVKQMAENMENSSITRNDLRELAKLYHYQLQFYWGNHGIDGRFDAVFCKEEIDYDNLKWPRERLDENWDQYHNCPIISKFVKYMESELRDLSKRKLPDYMIPTDFVIVDSFPLTSNGKIDRDSLVKLNRERAIRQNHEIKIPNTPTQFKMQKIFEKLLNTSPISIDDNFFEVGGDSLLAVRLMAYIKEEFNKKFPIALLIEYPSIELLSQKIDESQEEKERWDSLVQLRKEGKQPPIFCLPGIGGDIAGYYPIVNHLDGFPIYGLRARGLDGIGDPVDNLEEMSAHYIEEISKVQKSGPYYLLGHSFGAKIAFEVAQQLHRMGEKIAILVVIDTPATTLYDEPVGEDWTLAQWLYSLASHIELFINKKINLTVDEFHLIDNDDDKIKHYMKRVRETAPQLFNLNFIQMKGYLRVFIANRKMQYRPETNYKSPIILFRANTRRDEAFGADRNPEIARVMNDIEDWGWSKHSLGKVPVYHIDGDHRTILNEPNIGTLCGILQSYLDKIVQNKSIYVQH